MSGTGGRPQPAAELTWALILGLARHVAAEDAGIRTGRWGRTVGIDLAGAVLGVIGLGNLGKRVATVGQAFGMRVIAWSQNLDPAAAAAAGVEAVDKQTLLRSADVVTIHLRLSERTRGLIGAADLALLKPTAFLVNTSRGPIVDEAALIDALRAGSIAGPALTCSTSSRCRPTTRCAPRREPCSPRISATSPQAATRPSTPARSRPSSPSSTGTRSGC